jgi:hypothetical protein
LPTFLWERFLNGFFFCAWVGSFGNFLRVFVRNLWKFDNP